MRPTIKLNEDDFITYQDIKEFVEKPLQSFLNVETYETAKILANMNINILYTKKDRGFITSDSPVIITDPKYFFDGYRRLGLASKTIEVTCPLSPKFAILITHYLYERYMQINDSFLEIINRNTRFGSFKEFIVNRDETDFYWFSKK